MTILVATEARFARLPDGRVVSTNGVDAYAFWRRYLDAFDRVLVAARTEPADEASGRLDVEGPGVEVRPLPAYRGPWEYLRRRWELVRAIAAAVWEADVLCLRAPGPIAGLAWRAREARRVAIEVVGDPLDSLGAGAVAGIARVPARAALARELRAMCRGADAVAYVTRGALQRRYPALGWSTHYSSIELPAEAFASDDVVTDRVARARAPGKGTAANPWRLVSVGTLAQLYKGHDVLIDAVARCRAAGLAVEATIVGDGAHRAALAARAADGVTFAGQLPAGAAVRAALDQADVFVLASRAEGLPRALIEAMARGLPGLATRVGGIPELLPDDRLVPPDDAAALAGAIAALCGRTTPFAALAHRDRDVARAYEASALRARRRAFYVRLRHAAERPLAEAG